MSVCRTGSFQSVRLLLMYGNRYLCWAFMEAANYAVRCDPLIRRWYERKRARKHRVVVIKAVAHKLARACYHMLHEGTTFDLTRLRLITLAAAGRKRGLASSQSL
jgi:transposase